MVVNERDQIRAQQGEIVSLRAQLVRAQSLAISGNAAALANRIIVSVDGWVDASTDPTNPDGYGESLDPAINAGIQSAAMIQTESILGKLPAEEVIGLAERTLSHEDLVRIATSGLEAAITMNPREALAALSEGVQQEIKTTILTDPVKLLDLVNRAVDQKPSHPKVVVPEVKPTNETIESMRLQLDELGYYEMGLLKENDRVGIKMVINNPNRGIYRMEVKGIVRLVDGTPYIVPHGDDAIDSPFTVSTENERGEVVNRIEPGREMKIRYLNKSRKRLRIWYFNTVTSVEKFSVDDVEL